MSVNRAWCATCGYLNGAPPRICMQLLFMNAPPSSAASARHGSLLIRTHAAVSVKAGGRPGGSCFWWLSHYVRWASASTRPLSLPPDRTCPRCEISSADRCRRGRRSTNLHPTEGPLVSWVLTCGHPGIWRRQETVHIYINIYFPPVQFSDVKTGGIGETSVVPRVAQFCRIRAKILKTPQFVLLHLK